MLVENDTLGVNLREKEGEKIGWWETSRNETFFVGEIGWEEAIILAKK